MNRMIMIHFAILCVLCAFHAATSDDVSTPHFCLSPPSQKCFTIIINQQLNWNDAEKYCERNLPNGRLASIHSAFEQNAIASSWLSFGIITTDPWIGAYQIGSLPFQWTDASALDYANWTPGQPSNGQCSQMCHDNAINGGIQCQQGKWRTADCERNVSQIICEYGNYSSAPTTAAPPTGTDCFDLLQANRNLPSGIYWLSPPGVPAFQAFCDMETDGGGWTVFQRRIDGTLSFYDKTWLQYRNGFDNGLNNSLWLGNDRIHILSTKDTTVELRVDIWGDRAPGSTYPNGYWWGKFMAFHIDDEANYYTFHIDTNEELGNASDSGIKGLNYNNGNKFSTIDVNHASCSGGSCSQLYQLGGWWLDNWTWVTLNGKYIPSHWHTDGITNGFIWNNDVSTTNPVRSRMMLRKVNF